MKLVIAEPLAVDAALLASLSRPFCEKGWTCQIYDTRPADQADLARRLADADSAVIANYPCTAEALAAAPRLSYLCVAFTGVDHVDTAYCKAHRIAVSNCAGYSTEAVAELALGMAVSLMRDLVQADRAARSGGTNASFLGGELAGKKFGIIGTGTIGRRTAELARAFHCDVWGWSRTPRDAAIHYTDLDTLLASCDILSIHLPLTDRTRGLIGKEEIAKMKPGALLINTARGPIVDYEALAAALRSGQIGGAAIDVYEGEPPLPANHPLLSAPHCLLTPHLGFYSAEAMARRATIVFENLEAWQVGAQRNVIC